MKSKSIMEDIFHPVLNNNSIFKVYQSKNESFLYSILAALYSCKIDYRLFHHPYAYKKYKNLINVENIPLPMKNKHINLFLKNNPKLNIRIRLFNSIVVSITNMKIFEHKEIGKGKKIINVLFHKTYKGKKSYYHYFWVKNLNNIKKTIKKSFVCVVCYERFSAPSSLNRHMISCNSMTIETYPKTKSFLTFDDKKAAKFASPISIMGFADFETKQECIDREANLKDSLGNKKSFTIRKSAHKIISFSLIFVDTDGKLIFEKTFCGQNAGIIFLKH